MRSIAFELDRDRFAVALLLVAIGFAACFTPAQSDTWWQLRAGQAMWHSHRVMLHDEFTYTVFGQPWPNHEWLSQVLFYAVYRTGGMPLLTALCAAAILAAWSVVAALTPGRGIVRLALVGIAAVASSPGWALRPQALTLALCALTLWMLVRRRLLYLLPFVFLIWANLHGAVALGGVLMVAAWLSAVATRDHSWPRLTIIGALCLAATAMTPLGVSLWIEIPHSLARLHAYGVMEFQPLGFTEFTEYPIWIAAVGTVFLGIARRERLQSFESLTLFVATALMFMLVSQSERNAPAFLMCAVPTLGILLESTADDRRRTGESTRVKRMHTAVVAASIVAAAVGVAIAWSRPVAKLAWKPLSDSLMTAIRTCDGPLYTRYDEGGYVIWFIPERKVFVDSRQDPFPRELVFEHIRAELSGDYLPLFTRYHIRCSLNPPASPLAAHLRKDGWREIDGSGPWTLYRMPAGGASSLAANAALR